MSLDNTQTIVDTKAYVEDSAKIYIIMTAVAIGSSIICIYISNSMSTPAAVAPVPASAPPAALVQKGMIVPFPAPDQKDYVLTGSGNWTSMSVSAGITVQNDVTGSRELGKVYRNTTGKPMFVSCSISYQQNMLLIFNAYSDSNPNPSTIVTYTSGLSVSFWVISDNYYKVAHPGATLVGNWLAKWIECH